MGDEKEKELIRGVIAEWMRATEAGDFESVLKLMAEDVVFLLPGRDPMRGRAAFASASRVNAGKFDIEGQPDIQEIEIAGNFAYCWNYLTITIKPKDGSTPMKRAGNILSVFRKEPNGRWVLFRDANLLMTVNA